MRNNENCIAIYSRKSKFTGKGESIGNQVELCKEYIKVHYGEEALRDAVIYEDEGFSGGNLNRPAFKEMMTAVKKRKHKAIIVYRLDRISRNISDFSGLIEELSYLNVAFISIREQFDTGSPMGRAMMYIASVFSQLERETIAERIRDNMHELAKTGRWLGGTTPTGYASESVKSITVDGKTKKACKLKIITQEIEIIKTIFDVFVETNSLTITEAELMRRFYDGVVQIPGVRVYGDFTSDERAAIVALNIGDYDSSEVSDELAVTYGISTRPGAHCAPLMHESFKTVEQGMVRFSFSYFNTEEEIDAGIQAVRELAAEE